MRLPEKEYYSLEDIADDCRREVDELLVCGINGKLEICLLANETAILKKIGLELNPELIGKLGPYPIPRKSILKIRNAAGFFSSIDRLGGQGKIGFRESVPSRKPISETHKTIIKEAIRETMAIPPLSKEEICKSLIVTHKERLRFEAICDMANSDDIKKQRVRSNELYDVIWAAYCDLKKRYDAPTSGQVWQKLVNNYTKYDTAELIQEIKRDTIYWINFKGEEKSLKESSFKGTLSKIKARKKSNKNSN